MTVSMLDSSSYAIQVRAANDIDGNPRRAWIVWSPAPSERAQVFVEHWDGLDAVPEAYRNLCRFCPVIEVTVAGYNKILNGEGLLG